MKLTLEQLKLRAAKYPTRSQFDKHDRSAYISAKRQGLLDTLYPHKEPSPSPLTFEELLVRAGKHRRRVDFKRADDSGYKSAVRQGFIEMLFPKPTRKRPNSRVPRRVFSLVEIANSAPSYTELRKNDPNAAEWLRRRGLIEKCFPSRKAPRKWSHDTAVAECSKYSSRSHLQNIDPSLYQYIRRNNLMESVFPKSERTSSNDSFYIKRLDGMFYGGFPVYKVGVTSSKLGVSRLLEQDRRSRMRHTITMAPVRVIGSATDIETFALSLGHNPKLVGFDGCTEYRAYSDADIQAIHDMVELCRSE